MIRFRRAALLLGALVVAVPAMAAGKVVPRIGLFGDVRESRETGDFSGVELEIFADHVDFVLCEGSCLAVSRLPITRQGDRILFDYIEQPVFSDGQPAPPTHTHVVARMTLRGVSLSSTGYLDLNAANLPPLRRRYGLAMAEANDSRR